VPKVRLYFTKLQERFYSRRLYTSEPKRPSTKRILLNNFTDDEAVVDLAHDHPTVLNTWLLKDSKEVAGSGTTFTFYPSVNAVAPDADELEVAPPKVNTDDAPPGTVEVTTKDPDPDPTVTQTFPDRNTQSSNTNQPISSSWPRRTVISEFRVSTTAVDNPSDALEADRIRHDAATNPTVLVPSIPGEDTLRVWVRRITLDENRAGAWQYTDVMINDHPEYATVGVQGDPTAAGTILDIYGVATLKISGSDLVPQEVPSMFSDATLYFPDSIFSYDDGPSMFSMDLTFPYGVFESEEIDFGTSIPVTFTPQFVPEHDGMARITERSIFSEDYYMFRPHDAQLADRGEAGVGFLREDDEDMNWLADQSDNSPMRVRTEVKLHDGVGYGEWRPWHWGQSLTCVKCVARVFLYSHRGLRIPTLKYWWVKRRHFNRKFEFQAPVAYPTTDGLAEYTFSTEVAEMFTVPGSIVASVIVFDDMSADDNTYTADVVSIASGVIKVRIRQVAHTNLLITSGTAVTWTFPRSFAAGKNPDVVATGDNGTLPIDLSALGVTSVVLNGTNGENVAAHAIGIPETTNRNLHIILTGY